MIHLKIGSYTETKYICIKYEFQFILNKEYSCFKDKEDFFYKIQGSWYSEEFIKEHFVINKKYYRELNLKALLDD